MSSRSSSTDTVETEADSSRISQHFVEGLIHEHGIEELHEKYDLASGLKVGDGANGKVLAIKRRDTGETFAMKLIKNRKGGDFDELLQEIKIHRKLDHPNIAKVLEYYCDE